MPHTKATNMSSTWETISHLTGKHPRNYTQEEEQQVVEAFAKLPLKELRRRQELAEIQRAIPYDPLKSKVRYDQAMENLDKMLNILTAAVSLKEFGTY